MAISAAVFSLICYLEATKRSPCCHGGELRQTDRQQKWLFSSFRTLSALFRNE